MKNKNSTSESYRPQNLFTQNHLWIYRKRMGYTQKQVAHLLGHKSASHLSGYEHGKRLPSLETALKLEIVLRVPIAYLYQDLCRKLKRKIHQKEDALRSTSL